MHIWLTRICFFVFFTFFGKTNTVFPSVEDFNEACAWGIKKKHMLILKWKSNKKVCNHCVKLFLQGLSGPVCVVTITAPRCSNSGKAAQNLTVENDKIPAHGEKCGIILQAVQATDVCPCIGIEVRIELDDLFCYEHIKLKCESR